MDKIDPKLWALINAHAAGELPPDPDNPDFVMHVYVAAENGDFGGIAAAGFDVASELDGTAIVTLAIPDIETLADRADVLAIFAPRSGKPLDGPVKAITTEQATVHLVEAYAVTSRNRPSGSHGEDVIVGIVDTGVNILHDAFTFTITENGKTVRKTRILTYWAQSRTRLGTTPVWERNGKVYTEAEINALLAAFDASKTLPPANVLDLDSDGNSDHGTGVASVAAGSDWRAGPDALGIRTGIAPAAKLIVVGGMADEIAGIEFCFTKAAASACVVNMSLGHHDQPHNGLSLFSRRLRGLLTQGSPRTFRPGRAFVIAAGNGGLFHNHFQLSLEQEKVVEVVVDPKPEQSHFGCLISSSKAGLKVSVAPPLSKGRFTPAGPYARNKVVAAHSISIGALRSIQQQGADDLPSDNDSHILIGADLVKPTISHMSIRPGVWRMRLDPGTDPHPNVHLWLTQGTQYDSQKLDDLPFLWAVEDDGSGMDPRWRRRKEWIEATLTSQASTAVATVVGGTSWSKPDVWPVRVSSRGPATDTGRPAADLKPDLLAPSVKILVARWRKPRRASDVPTGSARRNGTSFASPCVAGAVALMLSHDPTLTQDDIRQILRSTTSPWAAAVRQSYFVDREMNEQNLAGKGFLNIEGALKAVKARLEP